MIDLNNRPTDEQILKYLQKNYNRVICVASTFYAKPKYGHPVTRFNDLRSTVEYLIMVEGVKND